MYGGVIRVRLAGEEKKSQAVAKSTGKNCFLFRVYTFMSDKHDCTCDCFGDLRLTHGFFEYVYRTLPRKVVFDNLWQVVTRLKSGNPLPYIFVMRIEFLLLQFGIEDA